MFIDDFIGTGGSAQDYFRQIAKESGQILRKADIKIYFVAVTGFQKSQHNLEKTIVECDLPIKVHICDPLDSSAKCFGENSQIFAESSERLQAMRIAQDNGAKIEKRNPLGFGDCQTIIVFPDSCPNNNLPILWGESTKISWRPLFIRQMPRKHFYKQ